jgi:hypothetical protein
MRGGVSSGRPQIASAAISLSDPVRGGIGYALALIRTRYERNEDLAYNMPFHCVAHTVGVIRRTDALLRAMGASETEFQLGLLAAAFHDTVQNWAPTTTPDGRALRQRFTGRNEADSAAEAAAWMRRAGVFHEEDYELVTRAILTTIPAWDAVHQTVSQPQLTYEAPPVVRAVALADLGIAGMDGLPFLETGDQLFREENLDIDAALRRCSRRSDLGGAVLEGYKARMLAWSHSQPAFARGRRALLEQELGNLQGAALEAVRNLFCEFETAIRIAEDAARARESLPPWELSRAMGYPVPEALPSRIVGPPQSAR